MGDTFYSLLGVDADADGETIRHAYRDLVKECHPDVSDDPAAPERFKRLTTARDVLLDEGERARYDRLGHDAYVRQHVESSAWTAEAGADTTDTPVSARTHRTTDRHTSDRRRTGPGPASTGRSPGEAWPGGDPRRHRDRNRAEDPDPRGVGHATGWSPTERQWQQASGVYRRAETDLDGRESVGGKIVNGVRSIGPWLPIHVVFVLSALATGWFTYAQASRTLELSLPAVTFGILVLGVVISLSVVHLVSQLYS